MKKERKMQKNKAKEKKVKEWKPDFRLITFKRQTHIFM